MTHDNSDYEKVRTKLHELLPNVLKSDINETVFENLMNRFLTKQEIEKVAGYIGVGNPNAIVKRQIHEPTVHRQAFQLQPIVYNKVGSVEHMASWYDLLNELTRLGVNVERLPTWGAVQQFNWVPPVDIDKIINYQDYYWYNPETPGSLPEYITIRSRCSTAVANANFWERITDEFGLTIPFYRIDEVDEVLPVYDLESVNPGTQEVILSGDATLELSPGNFFIIDGTVSNDGEHKLTSAPVYSPVFNNTTFTVDGTINASEISVGTANIRRYNKLIIDGEYSRLLETGFVFFIRDSLNSELADSFWMVADSDYDESTHETTVKLEGYFTDSNPIGIISNEEQLNFYLAERDCQCTGSVGWDLLQWDDNPEDPLWGGVPPGDHFNLLIAISNPGAPVGAGVDGQLWYDVSGDALFQYSEHPLNTGWFALWNNFSLILEKTEGMAFWDLTPGCGVQSRIPAADQWIDNNFWFHKSDIPNFSIAKQAQYPILEYDWDLELNEWTYTDSIWQYRRDQYSDWEDTDAKPYLIELQPLDWWELDGPNDEIVLDERFGDLTSFFTVGSTFTAIGTGEGYEVERVHYSSDVVGEPYRTRIKLTVTVVSTALLPGDFAANRPSITSLIPVLTSQGSVWRDYGDQWLFVGFEDSLPTPHKAGNQFATIPDSTVPVPDPSGDFDYATNYAVQQYTLSVDGVQDFELSNQTMAGSLRPLTRRALVGFNDIRVYIDDVRQYGTYDEWDEDVVAVTNVNPAGGVPGSGTWTFASDMTAHVADGDQLFIDANTTGASGIYTVSVGGVAGNVVTVVEAITIGSAGNGNMSNLTSPMSGIDTPLNTYVRGIQFLAAVSLVKFQTVRIEVGEASINEFGAYKVPVRFDPVNTDFVANGFQDISLVKCRKNEQVKSSLNQYPLFDIYHVDGTPAYRANSIFGYRTDPSYSVVTGLGQRVVRDATTGEFEFDQFILDEDDGTLYAYRDYSNEINDFWYNPTTNELKFWDEFAWTAKTQMSTYYGPGIVSDIEPDTFYRNIDGFYWYDPTLGILNQRVTATNEWVEITNLDEIDYDVTLQTIWKKGLNDEEYVPAKVDWEQRSEAEYDEQKEETVEQRAQELMLADPFLTEAEALLLANAEWNASQANPHSPSGAWVGDWEIHDALYYNNQHENRKYLTIRELLTHFATIIEEQPKIPGYTGPKDSMFHLIPTNEVNYGIGGTIKEFNDGFDTFVSSLFVNNVTPLRLIAFAHDQYEALLNNLKETYRRNAIEIFSDTSVAAILDLSTVVTAIIIESHEQNDNAAFLYGDSTTFIDVTGPDDIGIRNWIITLPYLEVLFKTLPRKVMDDVLGITQLVHHDGHRASYDLVQAIVEAIIQLVNNSDDERTSDGNEAEDTLGRTSTVLPPNNINEFDSSYITPILGRQGVYWYTVQGADRVWYRLTVASVGTNEPSSLLADGTLWMDTTPGLEVLRQKTTLPIVGTVVWAVVDGLVIGDARLHNGTDPSDVTTATVSAWQPVDVNGLLTDTILEVENRLYEAAPDPHTLKYDVSVLQEEDPTTYNEYLEQAFLDYTSGQDIAAPYNNIEFDLSNPFTWNYKYSTPGAGVTIIEAEGVADTFRVPGDVTTLFDILGFQVTFFVKNSGANDGTWQTIVSTIATPSAIYNAIDDDTTVFVDGEVTNSMTGIAYLGLLPSSASTGGESGGDFRDLYEKTFGTPYPHIEPWALQGYTDQPTWWNDEYLNDDIDKWGDRRWKYKHGFSIVNVDAIEDSFAIDGDYREIFYPSFGFNVDNSFSVHDGVYVVENLTAITIANVGIPGSANIELVGDQTSTFVPGLGIAIASAAGDIQQIVTIGSAFFSLGVTTVILQEAVTDVTDWDFVSGATYNGVTNRTNILVNVDITNPTIEGRITVALGMWENIRIGVIPPGQDYSNGVTSVTGIPVQDNAVYGLQVPPIPTYNYMGVNIDNIDVSADGGTTVYGPDRLFPPYWDYTGQYTATVAPFDRTVRSIFFNFSTEITSPGVDYVFGDAGNVEWEWRQTSQFLYDNMTVAFRMDPIRYVAHTFGVDFNIVNDLQIDARLENTFSHTRTDFHGDVIGDTPYLVNGSNQWYVNFNRYGGYDLTWTDFRSLWTLWTAPMMYQFSSFIDTPSLNVGHRAIAVSEFDYTVLAKRSPGVDDSWFDAFDVAILNIPPAIVRYDNQGEWRFSVGTNLPVSRQITYHDVHNYQFYADPTTDLCTIYKWDITTADAFNDVFHVAGDQTHVFTSGRDFIVENSTGNDGNYTTVNSAYNAVTDRTLIEVNENFSGSLTDGTIQAMYRELPWQTGDIVSLTTAETMPVPLLTDTVNGLYEYFVIRVSDTEFRLALTAISATTNTYEDITTNGTGDTFVGQTIGTFNTDRSSTLWRRYVIDTTSVLNFATPETVTGMQNLVDIIFGYDSYTAAGGWVVNSNMSQRDPNSGDAVNWQVEIERFIDYAYLQRRVRDKVSERYASTVDVSSDIWTFTEPSAQFITGDKVVVLSNNNIYPSPIVRGLTYFMIRYSLEEFALAATSLDAQNDNPIDIISNAGTDVLWITPANVARDNAPHLEINPFRNNIWFRPERGIVSNVLTGPAEDVRTTQLVFDQYGRQIRFDDLMVMRLDKETRIQYSDEVPNDVELTTVFNDPYNYLHLGGMHLFVDSYEHVLKFNNYTSEDQLLYDPFIGLNVTKFEMLFNRQPEFTGRPNVGGYYLETQFNQGADLKLNIEASIDNLRYLYDTYNVLETNQMVAEGRRSLGYEGTQDYLDNLNLNRKSQFVFWRGMIQTKGSVNAIKAFVNSRRFIDAKVDEFWAIKIAEFGSMGEQEYPEMYINTVDVRTDDVRFQFARESDYCQPGFDNDIFDEEQCGFAFPDGGDAVLVTDDTFTPVVLSDEDRWYKQPDQLETLRNNDEGMYFDMEKIDRAEFVNILDAGGVNRIPGMSMIENDVATKRSRYVQWDAEANTWIDQPYGEASWAWDDIVSVNVGTQTWTAASPIPTTIYPGAYISIRNNALPEANGRYLVESVLGSDIVVDPDVKEIPLTTLAGGRYISQAVIRHNFSADYIEVTNDFANSVDNITLFRLPTDPPNELIGQLITAGYAYVPFTDSVEMFRNGDAQEALVDYTETWDGVSFASQRFIIADDLFSDDVIGVTFGGSPIADSWILANPVPPEITAGSMIYIGNNSDPASNGWYMVDYVLGNEIFVDESMTPIPVTAIADGVCVTDVFDVLPRPATLIEDLHFEQVNSDVVRFLYPELTDPGFTEIFARWTITGYLLNKEAQNPARLLDKESKVVVSSIQYWDPGRGFQHQVSMHNVDVQRDTDPAIYSYTAAIRDRNPSLTEPYEMFPDPWNTQEVGTTWLDDALMHYVPYYDEDRMTDLDVRYRAWGNLAEYGDVRAYEWVKSDIPPDEYNDVAATEEGNVSIDASVRKSGTVRELLYVPNYDVARQIANIDLVLNQFTIDDHLDTYNEWVGSRISASGSIVVPDPDWQGAYTITAFENTTGTRSDLSIGDVTIVTVEELIPSDSFTVDQSMLTVWVPISNGTLVDLDCGVEGIPDVGGYAFPVLTLQDHGIVWWVPVDVYINGRLAMEQVTVGVGTPAPGDYGPVFVVPGTKAADRVTFNYPPITDEDYIQGRIDVGAMLRETPYTQVDTINTLGQTVPEYYFWVRDKSTLSPRGNKIATMFAVERNLTDMPDAFMFFDKPIASEEVIIDQTTVELPHRYIQAILRGLRGYVTADNRYTLRWTRDFTLRDNLGVNRFEQKLLREQTYAGDDVLPGQTVFKLESPYMRFDVRLVRATVDGVPTRVELGPDTNTLILLPVVPLTGDEYVIISLFDHVGDLEKKPLHEEWELFRQEQQFHINRWQWDLITDSMIGYKLYDPTIRVPNYERELYDSKYGTDTRYGLGEGQAFTDGTLAIGTILDDLLNPDNDFYPVDINVFFERENFDTPEGIESAMNTIYNTFPFEHVNRMYFSVLLDALSVKLEYADLFKTSMIALHGIRPFQVAGVFDD